MDAIALPMTSLTAIILALLHLALTWRVITIRRKDGVVLGDNDDRVLTKAIRGQGNAAEQIPLGLILLALCELQGAPFVLLGILAVVFSVGRIMHAIYFGVHGTPFSLRIYGMFCTLVGQAGLVFTLALTILT